MGKSCEIIFCMIILIQEYVGKVIEIAKKILESRNQEYGKRVRVMEIIGRRISE